MSADGVSAGLPLPARTRWQPLRMGLVELYHYDCEEFRFHDGHLLLRGNNGTGKSKVLALTLPFLLDAQLSATRVEPDGDRNKRMDWNLLLGGKHERRIGYAWIEFGRRDDDGAAHYLTLGCGLHAVAGRARVDSWHFVTPQRVGQDLWLFSPEGSVLSRERLHDALGSTGQLFDTARDYRRAVDERLFRLGERYDALIDTLIQLRQPQLSRRPDEKQLSDALTAALPPLPAILLQEVADALSQLESYRAELTELEQLNAAVAAFGRRYRVYAQVQARRQARVLRQAQTEFDRASSEVNGAREAWQEAGVEVDTQRAAVQQGQARLQRDRAARDELAGDPLMRDARRLDELGARAAETADTEARAAQRLQAAEARLQQERTALQQREAETGRSRQRREAAGAAAAQAAGAAGVARDHDALVAPLADDAALAAADDAALVRLSDVLTQAAHRRLAQIEQVRRRLREVEQAATARERAQAARGARAESFEQAQAAAAEAEAALRRTVQDWLAAWESYLASLQEITLPAGETGSAPGLLAEWAESQAGSHPLRAAVQAQAQRAGAALAAARAAGEQHKQRWQERRDALAAEYGALQAGEHARPPAPPARAADARDGLAGAPLWQLVDFQAHVPEAERAGLEAALQAAGLLDAWVTPDGTVSDSLRHDVWLLARKPRDASLARWLCAAPEGIVDGAVIQAILAGIACGAVDDGEGEAWLAPDGRFRLGPAQGAWYKPQAEYIGFAAREAARQRRLQALGTEIAQCDDELRAAENALEQLAARARALADELARMPDDDILHRAHAAASAAEAQRRSAQERLAEADALLQRAENAWRRAGEQLALDAEDLQLPAGREALETVAGALAEYRQQAQVLCHAFADLRRALLEAQAQQSRLQAAGADHRERELEAQAARRAAAEAASRFETLRAAVGDQVEELQQRLHDLAAAVAAGERALEQAHQHLTAAEKRASAEQQKTEDRAQVLETRVAERLQAVAKLQGFAATGLLAVAVPDLDLPQHWTVDPALHAARRIEQALAEVDAGEDAWSDVQHAVSRDYTVLMQSLSAHGHRAEAETTDYGFVVHIVYGGRLRRPDVLESLLGDEIGSRREILTAREREVLESHLEREVAQHLQQRLRDAEARVTAINRELDARPTSTGVKFRLEWQVRPEGEEDAPAGLAGVRERLIRRVADAWSPDDRRAIGDFLKACIDAERERDAGAPLAEHLARALDYRTWHRFRVRRYAGGTWGALTGPASGGERALGLTVPLFAAASAHYASCDAPEAPRLVLLDEVFAGIDDEARAHCMALIRTFDLDFVMTSEREWGCYKELPGVAICHLLRRENVDAVFVSRWRWDGAARRPEDDPTRRTAATESE